MVLKLFSCLQPNVILTLEQSAALGGDLNQMNIDSCVYEVASGRVSVQFLCAEILPRFSFVPQLSRISVTTVAIHSKCELFHNKFLSHF